MRTTANGQPKPSRKVGMPPRRALLLAAGGLLLPAAASTQAARPSPKRALREMQIYKVPQLRLELWVENQPAWDAELEPAPANPKFVARSPSNYHPPTVMTYGSWPSEVVSEGQLQQVARTAIERASQNFGLDLAHARAIVKQAASYGVLSGFEGQFVGRVDGVAMDVKVFVGQANGRFPVALCIYTLAGKFDHLTEVVRRAWGKLDYLPA